VNSRSALFAGLVLLVSGRASAQAADPTDGASAAGVVAGSGPTAGSEAPPWADEALPPPVDEPPQSSARTNLLITGAAATLGFYGIAYGTSYLWPSSPVAEDLRIPVVGPYSAVFGAGCGNGERNCGTFITVLRTAFAAISGIGRTGGILLLGEALFLETSPNTSAGGTSTHSFASTVTSSAQGEVDAPSVYYAPIIDENSVGLSIGGSF